MANSVEQLEVIRLCQAMFNAAPGAVYLENLLEIVDAGNAAGRSEASSDAMTDLANALAASALFTHSSFYPTSLTNVQFAERMVASMTGDTLSEATHQVAVTAVTGFLDAGATRGEVMLVAARVLSAATAYPEWAEAAAQFNNRVEVSRYYSIDRDGAAMDLATLRSVTADVTHTAESLAAGKAVFDSTVTGTVQDGYIAGANIFADLNGDGIRNGNEPSTTTDAAGNFTLPAGTFGRLVASGGTDIATNLPFAGSFTAPAGSTVVNPLTTLVQAIMEQGAYVAEAVGQVQTALGLPPDIDLISFDPISEMGGGNAEVASQVLAAAVQVNNLLTVAASAIEGVAEETTMETAFSQVVTSLASQLAVATEAVSLADPGLLAEVMTAAVGENSAAVSTMATLATDVAAIVADSNATIVGILAGGGEAEEILAQIMQVATVAQGEATEAVVAAIDTGATNLDDLVANYTGEAFSDLVNAVELGDVDGDGATDSAVGIPGATDTPPVVTPPTAVPPSGGGSTVVPPNVDLPPSSTPSLSFTMTNANGVVTFGGTVTGTITCVTDVNNVATFSRGGVTAATTVDLDGASFISLTVGSDQMLELTAAQVDGLVATVEGGGTLLVQGLEDWPDADLSGIDVDWGNNASLVVSLDSSGDVEIGANANLGTADVAVTGNGTVTINAANAYLGEGSLRFLLGAGATMDLAAGQADSLWIVGEDFHPVGAVTISGLEDNPGTDLSAIQVASLTASLNSDGGVVIPTEAHLNTAMITITGSGVVSIAENADLGEASFTVEAGAGLELSVDHANGRLVAGDGVTAIVNASGDLSGYSLMNGADLINLAGDATMSAEQVDYFRHLGLNKNDHLLTVLASGDLSGLDISAADRLACGIWGPVNLNASQATALVGHIVKNGQLLQVTDTVTALAAADLSDADVAVVQDTVANIAGAASLSFAPQVQVQVVDAIETILADATGVIANADHVTATVNHEIVLTTLDPAQADNLARVSFMLVDDMMETSITATFTADQVNHIWFERGANDHVAIVGAAGDLTAMNLEGADSISLGGDVSMTAGQLDYFAGFGVDAVGKDVHSVELKVVASEDIREVNIAVADSLLVDDGNDGNPISATLTVAQFSALAGQISTGIDDRVEVRDSVANLAGANLDGADAVVAEDTLANLATADLTGVGQILVVDDIGNILANAGATALANAVSVTAMVSSDIDLRGEDLSSIDSLRVDDGDFFGNTTTATLSAGQADALGDFISTGKGDQVRVVDTLANIQAASNLSHVNQVVATVAEDMDLAGMDLSGINGLIVDDGDDASSITVTLSSSQYAAMTWSGGITLGAGDTVDVLPYNGIVGTDGDDTLQGATSDDNLFGRAGNDLLSGGKGSDNLDGGEGDDQLSGGSGWDHANYWIDAIADQQLTQNINQAGDQIDIALGDRVLLSVHRNGDGTVTVTGQNDAAGLGTDTIAADVESLHMGNVHLNLQTSVQYNWADGSDFADTMSIADIFPGAQDWEHPSLRGGGGDDVLTGRDQSEGGDWLSGGAGDDVIHGGAGQDGYNLWIGESEAPSLGSFEDDGAGTKTAFIQVGGQDAFSILTTDDGATFTVTGLNAYADQGSDTLDGVEQLVVDVFGHERLTIQLQQVAETYSYKQLLVGGLFTGDIDAASAFPGSTSYMDIQGDSADNRIIGSAGRNDINSGAGNDTIDGGDGLDTHWSNSRIDADLVLATGASGEILVQTSEASPSTIYTLAVSGDGTVTVTDANGDVDTVTNVEQFVFRNWFWDDNGQLTRDASYTITPVVVGDATERMVYGGVDFSVAVALPSLSLSSSDWIMVHDDSRSGIITGSVANDTLYWHGGNDTFVGGDGVDTARPYGSIPYSSGISFAEDGTGDILVQDGDTTLATISQGDGQFQVETLSGTTTLEGVEELSFWAYPQTGGMGRNYTLNLIPVVDPASKQLTIGAGVTDVTQLFADAGDSLGQYDWVTIYDDSTASVIAGSVSRDNLLWRGGDDTFSGGAGIDSARVYNSISYTSGICFAEDVNGAILVQDGDIALATITASGDGSATVEYGGDTLTLDSVETLSFWSYPQSGGMGKEYALNLIPVVDTARNQLTISAGTIDVAQLFADAGDSLAQYDWVIIDDDSTASVITGDMSNDNLYWRGGNDTFNGGSGEDSVMIYRSIIITTSGISFTDGANGAILVQDGDIAVATITTSGDGSATVEYGGDILTTENVETLQFAASYGGIGSINFNYRVDLINGTLQEVVGGVMVSDGNLDVGALLNGQIVDRVDISDMSSSSTSLIIGSAAADTFNWSGGNDTFDGGAGVDALTLYHLGDLAVTAVVGGSFDLVDTNNATVCTVSQGGAGVVSVAWANNGTVQLTNVESILFTGIGGAIDLTTVFT
ncbi:MAG: hypothetical protein ACOY3Z_12170 [Thermodesulfobacteriota bacterium]